MQNLIDNTDLTAEARKALAGVYAGQLTELEVDVINQIAPKLAIVADASAFARAVAFARPLLAEGLAVELVEGLYDNGSIDDLEHTWLRLRLGIVDPSAALLEAAADESRYLETSSETLYSVDDLDSALAWR